MLAQSIFDYLCAFSLGFFVALGVVLPLKAFRQVRSLAAMSAEIRGA